MECPGKGKGKGMMISVMVKKGGGPMKGKPMMDDDEYRAMPKGGQMAKNPMAKSAPKGKVKKK